MVINQGDIFWIEFDAPDGSGPGYKHPHVIVQNNIFNKSRIKTTVVCALTSNLRRADAPGNVLLHAGEANLSKQSVVNISQLYTVDKSELGDYIGALSVQRVRQIVHGLELLLHPRDIES